ncbi:hypothetical protein C5167_018780 [Papaver somniferum]|uniref:Bifunctional inhibitor/plant lipid transfer protein/seed storage helical domain-containing protein n=1 Tax=Papaver somniferum TaxID=3469 RepID=A0A4Y7IN94_PAPSO|nr:14 kDa proline-rich protein DC2.15-like [Papaver somniferum]RZC50353.1 hypothetical protein C5167_018780 [Papaver somniferum]
MAASKALTPAVLFLSLNILFFTIVTSTYVPCPPPPKKSVTPTHPPMKTPSKPASPKSPPPKSPPSTKPASCPRDTLKLGVCANLLNDIVHVVVGTPANTPCCSLISGLTDLQAAVCLCTAIKAQVLGINLNVAVDLSLIINTCGKKVPSGFKCA